MAPRFALLLALLATASGAALVAPHAKLVFVRHGQSTWNKLNLFTGWVDVELSELGVEEATAGGAEIKKAGLDFDVAFTSMLQRAQKTCTIVLTQSEQTDVPVIKDYRLNERHYGALQGKDKKETVMQFGEEQVKQWRRSYDIPPPPVEEGSEHDPKADPLYAAIDADCLPSCECLKDTVARCLPLWEEQIAPALMEGQTVLVAAHGNSIRGLVKYLDAISEDEITSVEIPTGIPLVYDLDADLRPIRADGAIAPLTGAFLGDLKMDGALKLTVKDVDTHDFIAAYAQHLKRSGKVELPKWVEYVKTGPFKELAPYDEDWYFVRAAAIARKIYIRPGTGIGGLCKAFGGKKRRGTLKEKFQKASPGIIRTIVQSLEAMNVVEKCEMGSGRRITRTGQMDLDRIAASME